MNISPKKALFSKNIFPTELSDPVEGFLIVFEDKVETLIPTSDTTYLQMTQTLKSQGYDIIDYTNLYITPGVIDTNVSLSSNFDPLWQDIANITKMAASGGITTIIDHPNVQKSDPDSDELAIIKQRVEGLENKLYVDCGLLANISFNNLDMLADIIANELIIGIKFSMQPPLIPSKTNEPIANFKEVFKRLVSKSSFFKNIVFFLNCEKASYKDLFATSPCRAESLEKRLDPCHNISKFSDISAGGFSHSIGQDDSPISSNQSDSEKDLDEINEEQVPDITPKERKESFSQKVFGKKSGFSCISELNSGELKKRSIELDDKKTFEHLRNIELSGYQHEDLGCIKENFEDEQELNFSTDEDLKNSEDSISLLEEDQDSMKNNSGGTGFSNNNNSTMSIEPSTVELTEKNKKKPFCAQLKGLQIIQRKSPLIQEINNPIKCESENGSIKNYEIVDSPHSHIGGMKKKRNSLFDRRNVSPLSSPLLPFSLEITTPKIGEAFKASGIKSNDNSAYEREIAKKYDFFIVNRCSNLEREGIKTVFRAYSDLDNSQKSTINIILSNISLSSSCSLLHEQKKIDCQMNIFCEVGLGYLVLHDKKIRNGNCQFKCSPPIRDKENMHLLKAHLMKNSIDLVGSAHLRVPFKYKIINEGNFRRAFSGLSSVGLNLQIIWTILHSVEKYGARNKTVKEKIKILIKMLCVKPARIMKIDDRKGSLEKGKDADFVVWNPFEKFRMKKENILVKDKSLYAFKNFNFYGKVQATFLRGCKIFDVEGAGMEGFTGAKGEILKKSK